MICLACALQVRRDKEPVVAQSSDSFKVRKNVKPVAVESQAAREAKEMLIHVEDVRRVTEKVQLKGPVAAVKALAKTFSCEDEKRSWAILASKQALMGSCPKSERFVASGIRC